MTRRYLHCSCPSELRRRSAGNPNCRGLYSRYVSSRRRHQRVHLLRRLWYLRSSVCACLNVHHLARPFARSFCDAVDLCLRICPVDNETNATLALGHHRVVNGEDAVSEQLKVESQPVAVSLTCSYGNDMDEKVALFEVLAQRDPHNPHVGRFLEDRISSHRCDKSLYKMLDVCLSLPCKSALIDLDMECYNLTCSVAPVRRSSYPALIVATMGKVGAVV